MTVAAIDALLAAAVADIVDALGSEALAAATAAGDDLEERLRALDEAIRTARRVLVAPRI
jgi:hypothetical protein